MIDSLVRYRLRWAALAVASIVAGLVLVFVARSSSGRRAGARGRRRTAAVRPPRTATSAPSRPSRSATHALRAYWATTLLDDGVPIHRVSERFGHVELRTTSRYVAVRPG